MQVKKQQLEPDVATPGSKATIWTGSKLWKKYVKAVYYHPAYLTYMQSTLWKMLGWMKLKLDSDKAEELEIKLAKSSGS